MLWQLNTFDPISLASFFRDYGPYAVIAVLIVGGIKGWYVFGPHYREALTRATAAEAREERTDAEYKALMSRLIGVTREVVDVAKR